MKKWLVTYCLIVLIPLSLILSLLVLARSIWAIPRYSNSSGASSQDLVKRSSSAVTITNDGLLVVTVNPDSNTLSLIDAITLEFIAEIPVGVGPRSVVVAPDNNLAYVVNQGSDTLSIVDLREQTVIETISSGNRPVGVVLSPDGRFLAIAELGDDTIRFLDTATLTTLSVRTVPDRPHGLTFTPDGRFLLITHLLNGRVTILSVQPYRQFLPIISNPYSVSDGEASRAESRPLITADSSPISEISTWPNVAPAPAVIVNAAGTRAYLPQTMANGLGLNTQFDNTVFPKVAVLNLDTWSHQTSEHISLPEVDRPVGLPWDAALARNDTELWVVNAASNDISVIDISNPTRPVRRAHIPVGDNPRSIVISPDGKSAFVNNTLAGTISVIDTENYTITAVITTTQIPLPTLLLRGKRLFHSSATPELTQARWIACNTCHIEGEHDGRTWLLQFTGELPPGATPVITRNTTSLLGMIETYPLRWSAEWDESADSEFSIRFEQFGSGLIEGNIHPTLGLPNQGRSDDLDCLAAFIDSLTVPERHHRLTPAEKRGQMIFESAQTGCMDCHPPPLYTDLQVHDVGTADASGEWFGPEIDTPTLRYLYDSAPYLHDGRSATLLHLLTNANSADKHGITSHLTEPELADLIAFLLALPFD